MDTLPREEFEKLVRETIAHKDELWNVGNLEGLCQMYLPNGTYGTNRGTARGHGEIFRAYQDGEQARMLGGEITTKVENFFYEGEDSRKVPDSVNRCSVLVKRSSLKPNPLSRTGSGVITFVLHEGRALIEAEVAH